MYASVTCNVMRKVSHPSWSCCLFQYHIWYSDFVILIIIYHNHIGIYYHIYYHHYRHRHRHRHRRRHRHRHRHHQHHYHHYIATDVLANIQESKHACKCIQALHNWRTIRSDDVDKNIGTLSRTGFITELKAPLTLLHKINTNHG